MADKWQVGGCFFRDSEISAYLLFRVADMTGCLFMLRNAEVKIYITSAIGFFRVSQL